MKQVTIIANVFMSELFAKEKRDELEVVKNKISRLQQGDNKLNKIT